jgi:hypothetical protein
MSSARRARALVAAVSGAVLAALVVAAPAAAHDERPPIYPDGTGSVPAYRTDGPALLVCKTDGADFARRIAAFPTDVRARNQALFAECRRSGYRHLQAAVNAVRRPGTRILVLPGLYQEEPSLGTPSAACASIDAPPLATRSGRTTTGSSTTRPASPPTPRSRTILVCHRTTPGSSAT